MTIAIDDLRLDHLWIVTPGSHEYPVNQHISVLPLAEASQLARLTR